MDLGPRVWGRKREERESELELVPALVRRAVGRERVRFK